MYFKKLTRNYMIGVIACGIACLAVAFYRAPFHLVDLRFLVLFCFTVGLGSRVSVQIPKIKSHISVSDTFIFLALLMYGGELAVILAAIDAIFSSWRFCSKWITIWFNSAAMAISTGVVAAVLVVSGFDPIGLHRDGENFVQSFIIGLCLIALVQFVVNTALASVHESLKNGSPLWQMWKEKYAWSFASYLIGVTLAGTLELMSEVIGFGVIVVSFPVIYFVFLAYRMYLQNVDISFRQAEQAKEYAKVLEDRSAALRESEERFRSAFDHAPIGIALVSPNGTWLKVNRAICKILGYSEGEFLEMTFQSIIFPQDLGDTLVRIHELTSGKKASCEMEQRYLHKSGRTVWVSWSVSAATDQRSEGPNLIFQIQDITDKKIAEEKLQHEATHDALTGLPNRTFFLNRLSNALKIVQTVDDYKVSILFIDLDRFKNVNDSLGHLIGDQLLKGIAERLRHCMRPADVVARLGGDEFTILVEGRYDVEEVTRVAERIQQRLSMPFNLKGHQVYSSASIGILHSSEKHRTSEDMMRDADTAMYHAKKTGKAKHEVFDDSMGNAARETLLLETELRRAVEDEAFDVHYQPIFSLADNSINSIEALVRWHHPTMGPVPPDRFIPIAEELGLIDAVGEWVLRRACRDAVDMRIGVAASNNFKLSVNLSSRQFAREDLVSNISSILDETGFPVNRLKLEITETVFFEHHERALETLGSLQELGILTDIDDFGTGYSNLGYLVRLPISTLKIDRSFVTMMEQHPANREVIKTVIALAGNLGLKVIAEGIETEEQRAVLHFLGCHYGQGFLFARPMSAFEMSEFLRMQGREDGSIVPPIEVTLLSAVQ